MGNGVRQRQAGRQATGGRHQHVGAARIAGGDGRIEHHPLIGEIVTLRDRQPNPFCTRGFDKARHQASGDLVRVADAVAAGETIFTEHLRKAESGVGGVEHRKPVLVAEWGIDVEQARFQRLRHGLPQEPGVAFEGQTAVD